MELEMRTGVWYHDRPFTVTFPDAWEVTAHWPATPPPLTDEQIRERMHHPTGQPPLRELARTARRPIVIVDDLSRPTPVSAIFPHVLEEFYAAGIAPDRVTVLVATGTHGPQHAAALARKLGPDATQRCHVQIHHDRRHTSTIGRTSFGTPVAVNRALLQCDLAVGISGIYPQDTTGFGGGAKLALGVLGRRTITHMHYTHEGVGGSYNIDNDFRRDITEICRMIRLNTIYTLHINARQEVVNLTCGDHYTYYAEAAAFSKSRYTAPPPTDADVVIANTYPSDVSYTFMRKGMKVIYGAPVAATRIVIGSHHEGIGRHGLFPQGKSARYLRVKELYARALISRPSALPGKIVKRLFASAAPRPQPSVTGATRAMAPRPIWLYRPEGSNAVLPRLPGIHQTTDWQRIITAIEREQSAKQNLRVMVYPCASLQCVDFAGAAVGAGVE
ncbi:MAG: lactate racemase domain-containing protein [Nitrospirota bacterium]